KDKYLTLIVPRHHSNSRLMMKNLRLRRHDSKSREHHGIQKFTIFFSFGNLYHIVGVSDC
ncbi:1760_t:CDS:1, partial [Racocetra persica]